MNVVYPMPPRVDWRKREDIISRHRKPTQWTTDPGEPFIVQFLKELAIRRRRENLQLLEPSVENSKVALMRDEILDPKRGLKKSEQVNLISDVIGPAGGTERLAHLNRRLTHETKRQNSYCGVAS